VRLPGRALVVALFLALTMPAQGYARVPNHRPDARLAISGGRYVGDDIYDATGRRQSRSGSVKRGQTLTLYLSVQNDGRRDERFGVQGGRSTSAFRVRYYKGKTDITSTVIAGTYRTAKLSPRGTATIKVLVTAYPGSSVGARVTRTVVAWSPANARRQDTVRFTAVIAPETAELRVCTAIDGGMLAAHTNDGYPIYYGLTPPTRMAFRFRVLGRPITVEAGGCTSVGVFEEPQDLDPVVVQQEEPRAEAGVGIAAIGANRPGAVNSSSIAERRAVVRPPTGRTDLTFTERAVCQTTWSGNPGGMAQAGGFCQEANAGLAELNVLVSANCTVAIDPFTEGTGEEVRFTVTKASDPATFTIEAISVDGTRALLTMEM